MLFHMYCLTGKWSDFGGILLLCVSCFVSAVFCSVVHFCTFCRMTAVNTVIFVPHFGVCRSKPVIYCIYWPNWIGLFTYYFYIYHTIKDVIGWFWWKSGTVCESWSPLVDKGALMGCMWTCFPDRFPTLCLDSIDSPLKLRWVKGVLVLRCNMPLALLAEWPGSFTCHCSSMCSNRNGHWMSRHRKWTHWRRKIPCRFCQVPNWWPSDRSKLNTEAKM